MAVVQVKCHVKQKAYTTVPAHEMVQIQGHLLACRIERAYLVSWTLHSCNVFEVGKIPNFEQQVQAGLDHFRAKRTRYDWNLQQAQPPKLTPWLSHRAPPQLPLQPAARNGPEQDATSVADIEAIGVRFWKRYIQRHLETLEDVVITVGYPLRASTTAMRDLVRAVGTYNGYAGEAGMPKVHLTDPVLMRSAQTYATSPH